jgi:hypothetical protein
MFSVEHEFDSTIVTCLDEDGKHEDLQIILSDGVVFIRQWQESLDRFSVLEVSYKQFLDMISSMHKTEGLFKVHLIRGERHNGVGTT